MRECISGTLDAIFRQEFFEYRMKIKFSFLLVASLGGFYSQAAGREGIELVLIRCEQFRPITKS
jgi:hypothetical protein